MEQSEEDTFEAIWQAWPRPLSELRLFPLLDGERVLRAHRVWSPAPQLAGSSPTRGILTLTTLRVVISPEGEPALHVPLEEVAQVQTYVQEAEGALEGVPLWTMFYPFVGFMLATGILSPVAVLMFAQQSWARARKRKVIRGAIAARRSIGLTPRGDPSDAPVTDLPFLGSSGSTLIFKMDRAEEESALRDLGAALIGFRQMVRVEPGEILTAGGRGGAADSPASFIRWTEGERPRGDWSWRTSAKLAYRLVLTDLRLAMEWRTGSACLVTEMMVDNVAAVATIAPDGDAEGPAPPRPQEIAGPATGGAASAEALLLSSLDVVQQRRLVRMFLIPRAESRGGEPAAAEDSMALQRLAADLAQVPSGLRAFRAIIRFIFAFGASYQDSWMGFGSRIHCLRIPSAQSDLWRTLRSELGTLLLCGRQGSEPAGERGPALSARLSIHPAPGERPRLETVVEVPGRCRTEIQLSSGRILVRQNFQKGKARTATWDIPLSEATRVEVIPLRKRALEVVAVQDGAEPPPDSQIEELVRFGGGRPAVAVLDHSYYSRLPSRNPNGPPALLIPCRKGEGGRVRESLWQGVREVLEGEPVPAEDATVRLSLAGSATAAITPGVRETHAAPESTGSAPETRPRARLRDAPVRDCAVRLGTALGRPYRLFLTTRRLSLAPPEAAGPDHGQAVWTIDLEDIKELFHYAAGNEQQLVLVTSLSNAERLGSVTGERAGALDRTGRYPLLSLPSEDGRRLARDLGRLVAALREGRDPEAAGMADAREQPLSHAGLTVVLDDGENPVRSYKVAPGREVWCTARRVLLFDGGAEPAISPGGRSGGGRSGHYMIAEIPLSEIAMVAQHSVIGRGADGMFSAAAFLLILGTSALLPFPWSIAGLAGGLYGLVHLRRPWWSAFTSLCTRTRRYDCAPDGAPIPLGAPAPPGWAWRRFARQSLANAVPCAKGTEDVLWLELPLLLLDLQALGVLAAEQWSGSPVLSEVDETLLAPGETHRCAWHLGIGPHAGKATLTTRRLVTARSAQTKAWEACDTWHFPTLDHPAAARLDVHTVRDSNTRNAGRWHDLGVVIRNTLFPEGVTFGSVIRLPLTIVGLLLFGHWPTFVVAALGAVASYAIYEAARVLPGWSNMELAALPTLALFAGIANAIGCAVLWLRGRWRRADAEPVVVTGAGFGSQAIRTDMRFATNWQPVKWQQKFRLRFGDYSQPLTGRRRRRTVTVLSATAPEHADPLQPTRLRFGLLTPLGPLMPLSRATPVVAGTDASINALVSELPGQLLALEQGRNLSDAAQ